MSFLDLIEKIFIAMKSLVKIYANACICIYFKRAASQNDFISYCDESLMRKALNML